MSATTTTPIRATSSQARRCPCLAGRRIVRDGNSLYAEPLLDARVRLVPVTESSFRLENEIDASRVFTSTGDGQMVMTGGLVYAERVSRWPIDVLRTALLAALLIVASVFIVAIAWVARLRRAQPRGFWELKAALLLCPLALLMPVGGLALTPMTSWGVRNAGTIAVAAGTLAVPVMAVVVAIVCMMAMRERASRSLVTYAGLVALAMGGLSMYLSHYDMIGLRLWAY